MTAFLIAVALLLAPPDSADSLDACLQKAPVQSDPPISLGSNLQQMWTDDPVVPPDTVRAYLLQLQDARRCFLSLDPSTVERPYLGNIMRTFYVEAAHLAALRRFSEAFGRLEEAISYLQSNPDIPSTRQAASSWRTVLHRDRGYLRYLLGNLSAAIDHYLSALEKTPEENTGQRITLLLDIGLLHQRTQDYASAHHFYQRAKRLLQERELPERESGAPPSSHRARLLHYRADLLLEKTLNTTFDREDIRRAKTLAQRGRAAATPGTERHARVSMGLSESLGYLGLFERAYQLNREVRRFARRNDDGQLHTFALLKLGVLHVQTRRLGRADSVFQQALAQAKGLKHLDNQRRILRGLGRLHEMREEWGEAETFYRQGVDVIAEYRESLTASQWSTTAFAQWRDVHRGLVRTLLAQDRPREALTILDRSRARHLEDLRTRARVANQLPPADRTRLDSLSRALTDVRNRLSEPTPDTVQADLRTREAALMAARQQLLRIDSDVSRPSVDQIAETLRAQDRALVSYFLDDPWPVYDRTPRSVAFVLTGDSLRTVPLPGLTQDSVQTHVEAISPLYTNRGHPDRTNAMHFDLQPLHRLHDAVYKPVANYLPEETPLTVIPDGPLFHLPFSMLVDSMPGGRYAPAEARYVLHDRPVSTELASSLVVNASQQNYDWSQFEPQVAAYGVSDFDTLQSTPRTLRSAVPESLTDTSLALPSLPGVQRELRSLRSTLPDARVALDEQASEPSFCRAARTAGVLHVASHAFVNASSPLQNAILLRSGERSPQRTDARADSSSPFTGSSDGILFLHELQGQQTRIPMVVLSGCSTASGTLRGGEGMEGLQYAFRAMGAQSTVSTLWPVADLASVELMEGFYGYLQDGYSKDAALRQAQLDFLEANPQKASPFFWAAPVVYGSPAPLPLDNPVLPTWAWWGVAIGGLLLALLLSCWYWFWGPRGRPPYPSP